jgi:ribose transport system permease protein
MQQKDRDGMGGFLSGLQTPDAKKLLRFSVAIIGVLSALLAIGAILAVDPTPTG